MTLLIPHVDVVKASVGDTVISALSLIFERSMGTPPNTPSDRFRADYPELIGVLDPLGWDQFLLKRDSTNTQYRVSGYALPLIESPRANKLLELMDVAYVCMQHHYKKFLREPIAVDVLVAAMEGNADDAKEALCYMEDISGWSSGLPRDFPYDAGGAVTVNEQVLVCKTFAELLARAYEWNYVTPKKKATSSSDDFVSIGGASQPTGFFGKLEATEYPAWREQLDDTKKTLLREIDIGMRNDLSALPMMGLRALLESVMVERVGDDGGFDAKLTRLEKNGYVATLHADAIRKVLDAGHASMHRTYFPSAEDLQTCVDVVAHLLQGLYVLHPRAQLLSQNVPPRRAPK